MAARMKIEHRQTQLLATLHLVEKRLTAFTQLFVVGAAEIYKKIIMRENDCGSEA